MLEDKDKSLIMDYVNKQFETVNKKLDKLTELTEQTHLQEYRLNKLEDELKKMQASKAESVWRIVTPVISSIVSAVISFIIAGGLSK